MEDAITRWRADDPTISQEAAERAAIEWATDYIVAHYDFGPALRERLRIEGLS